MKENKLKVSFFVQAKRTDKKGLVPVIGRISVDRTVRCQIKVHNCKCSYLCCIFFLLKTNHYT